MSEQNEIVTAQTESLGTPRAMSRRSLVASAVTLGGWGVAAAALGFYFTRPKQDEGEAEDDIDLSEASTIRPERAVPQGEAAAIMCGGDSDETLPIDIDGTIRLRVIGSWLYDTGDAFERSEGISIADNYRDVFLTDEAEKERAYYEAHPEQAEKRRVQQQESSDYDSNFKGHAERVDDLQEEFDRRNLMAYAEDWSLINYRITTQMLLDEGYKLLTYDLEVENINARNHIADVEASDGKNDVSADSIPLPGIARGSDVAVWDNRFYLKEGEGEPSAGTFEESSGHYTYIVVPQGETRQVHVVVAVSPRSLKGELSLFMGSPLWMPTVPDSVVLLALEPELVS